MKNVFSWINLVGYLPLSVRAVAGQVLGRIVSLFATRDRQIARLQLKRFLGKDDPSILTRMYGSIGQSLLESLNLKPYLCQIDRHISCNSWENIHEWMNAKRGIVCFTGHVGNWDLLAAYMVQKGIPLTVIGKEMRNSELQDTLDKIRLKHGIKTLWRNDSGAGRHILRELRSGHVIGALIDQDTNVTSMMSSFFGTPAKTPSTLAEMGLKTEVIFVTAFLVRTGFLKYQVIVEELHNRSSPQALLDEYHQHLEKIIRAHPEQWVWLHKRWRTLSSGETMGGRAYLQHLASFHE